MNLVKCSNCGREMKKEDNFCTHCGSTIISENNFNNKKMSTLAISGFVVSLISLLIIIFSILGIIGLILSICALNSIKKNNNSGKGFAIAGLVMGIISTVISVTMLVGCIATPIVLDIIDDTRASSSQRRAELIINEVELAYSTAYMKNGGNNPTISEVAEAFDLDGVNMYSSGDIYPYDTNITCSTTIYSNYLKVSCYANGYTVKTKSTMKLKSYGYYR